MKQNLFNEFSMDEIHQKILDSVRKSDEFDNKTFSMFIAILLDMFIHKNDGLRFFVDYYIVTKLDLELYFKEPFSEYLGSDIYNELEKNIGVDDETIWIFW